MTEDEVIATFFAPLAGPGGLGLKDDAALLSPEPDQEIVATVDALVAGVHFFADDPPESIAAKALGVNLSDLAAKAAEPAGFLLTLARPTSTDESWLQHFARGLGEAAAHHGCPLIGGDTVRTPGPLTVSITAFGTVPRGGLLPRTGLRPGDRIYVSGTIGDAALGLALRQGTIRALDAIAAPDRAVLLDRYHHPQPRLALRTALRSSAGAGMDVSDGLVGDVAKMLRASGVGGVIRLAATPFSPAAAWCVDRDAMAWQTAVTGGDDYEILAGVPAAAASAFEAAALRADIQVTHVGDVGDATQPVVFRDRVGVPVTFDRGAFQHF